MQIQFPAEIEAKIKNQPTTSEHKHEVQVVDQNDKIVVEDTSSPHRERILEAFRMTLAQLERLEDPEYVTKIRDKLARSGVKGSNGKAPPIIERSTQYW
jgi:hypothetical protein